MRLFGSKKKEREVSDEEDALELFHIAALAKGTDEDEAARLEKKIFGRSYREVASDGRLPRFLIRNKDDDTCWTALGRAEAQRKKP